MRPVAAITAKRARSASPLLHLPDDLWHQLSRHLAPAAIFSLLQTNRRLSARLRPLVFTLTTSSAVTPKHTYAAILAALRADVPLASFLLRVAPPFSDTPHPLPAAFLDTDLADSLPAPVIRRLARHFLRTATPADLFAVLEDVVSINTLLSVTSVHLIPEPQQSLHIARLTQAKTLRGDTNGAKALIAAHPHTAALTSCRVGCVNCAGRHALLHVAAEAGDVDVLRAAVAALADRVDILNMRDCDGETPLSIAIRKRRSRVAQELVRGGAEVRELVGCAARGGGALDAGDVWFKPVVDVD